MLKWKNRKRAFKALNTSLVHLKGFISSKHQISKILLTVKSKPEESSHENFLVRKISLDQLSIKNTMSSYYEQLLSNIFYQFPNELTVNYLVVLMSLHD